MSNAPCPFCGGRVDPVGWLRNDGVRGPECDDCGATAPSLEAWNRRVTTDSKVYLVRRYGSYFLDGACGYTGSLLHAGVFSREEAEKHLQAEGVTIHPASEVFADIHKGLGQLAAQMEKVRQIVDSI